MKTALVSIRWFRMDTNIVLIANLLSDHFELLRLRGNCPCVSGWVANSRSFPVYSRPMPPSLLIQGRVLQFLPPVLLWIVEIDRR
jgi:hypothetical protein